MNTAKTTMLGGLLAVALVAGLAVDPAQADTFVSVSVGSGGSTYVSVPGYVSVSYSDYSPSYRSVSYERSTYVAPVDTSSYSVSYTRYAPSYSSTTVYTSVPSTSYYSSRTYYSGSSYESTSWSVRSYEVDTYDYPDFGG
ncbi:MAG: hypothetical protein JXQ73_16195 [Phycisphaerae bacterium]|nr:hypothetical protein [Phycisphaerae bacterium]